MSSRKVLSEKPDGSISYARKPVAVNCPEWDAYKRKVWGILLGDHKIHLRFRKPAEGERVVLECTWFLKNERSDCVNYHDLLADAIKEAIDVDDRLFLIRDRWAEVDPKRPRVEVSMWVERAPTSSSR